MSSATTIQPAFTHARAMFEQHATKIAVALVVAVLLWVGATLTYTSQVLARQSVQIENIERRMDQATRDRYRGTDAARDFARIEIQIEELQRRITHLEDSR